MTTMSIKEKNQVKLDISLILLRTSLTVTISCILVISDQCMLITSVTWRMQIRMSIAKHATWTVVIWLKCMFTMSPLYPTFKKGRGPLFKQTWIPLSTTTALVVQDEDGHWHHLLLRRWRRQQQKRQTTDTSDQKS